MRAYLDIEVRQAELFAVVTADGVPRSERPVRWAGEPGRRLLAAPTAGTVPGAAALAAAVDTIGDDPPDDQAEKLRLGAALATDGIPAVLLLPVLPAGIAEELTRIITDHARLRLGGDAELLLTRVRAAVAPHVPPPVLDDIVLFLNVARYRS